MILGKCEYDPELRELSIEGQSPQVIGHVQAKLLQLLYSNPDQYFSNDDLQREVWDGRVIENTTIRTTVSYLRKALGESEDCKYIDSGRNKGYRFVADIEEITPQRQFKRFFPFAVIAGLAILLIYVVFQSSTPQVVPKIETTLAGQELEATVSGELMVFSHKAQGTDNWNLYSKQIGKESYFRLTDGRFDDRHAALSEDGSHIAFIRNFKERCQVIVAAVDQTKHVLVNEKGIFDCPENSSLVSVAWQNRNNIYLSLADSRSAKYQIALYNLESKASTPITTPRESGRGDYYVASNNVAKKIAYLRNVLGHKTQIWIYDELLGESYMVVSIPMILMSVSWINPESLVVRTGQGQLSRLDINNGKLQTIFETSGLISFPYAISNSAVGYMKGFLTVRDIVQIDPDGSKENVISSSFRDYYPVYAEKSGSIAFISNRTGKNQIWIRSKQGELSQVTSFKGNLRIGSLTISRDGKYLAFLINSKLWVVDSEGVLLFKSEDSENNVNPAFSHNSDRVFYASEIKGEWYIEYRFMTNLAEKAQLTEGYVIEPCIDSDCVYFIKHKEPQLYKWEDDKVLFTGVILKGIARSDQLVIVDNLVYYLQREGINSELIVRDMKTGSETSIMSLATSRVSIQEEPFRIYTSISRETETLLQSVDLVD